MMKQTFTWKSPKSNPPKCGQTVLLLLNWGNSGYVITTAYVVKYKGKRHYTASPFGGSGLSFRQYEAANSYSFRLNEIVGWTDIKNLIPS